MPLRSPMADYRVQRPSSPDEILGAAVDKMLSAYSSQHAQEFLESATPGQRLLLAWYFYWDDVTNGGHSQYFGNYTGDLWPEALEATEALRLPEAPILREAVALFPGGKPALAFSERREQVEEVDADKLEELDSRFNEGPGSAEQLQKYVDEHPDDFFLPEKA